MLLRHSLSNKLFLWAAYFLSRYFEKNGPDVIHVTTLSSTSYPRCSHTLGSMILKLPSTNGMVRPFFVDLLHLEPYGGRRLPAANYTKIHVLRHEGAKLWNDRFSTLTRQSDVTENSAPCWIEENPSGYSSKQWFVMDKNGYVTGSAGTLKCRLHKRNWTTGFLSVKYNESKSIDV